MATDAELLRHYADTGAEAPFAELVKRHLDGVYSAAFRRVGGDSHLAEDVAQQVFSSLARRARRIVPREATLTGWLYRATRNAAANVVRSEQRRKAREEEAHAMSDRNLENAHDVEWSRVAPLLDTAIDQLRENDRIVVLMRFVERRSFAEIGKSVRLSEDAARMRVDRSLEKLRRTLARQGISSSSAALAMAMAAQTVTASPGGLAATITATAYLAPAPVLGLPIARVIDLMSKIKLGSGAVVAMAMLAAIGTAGWEIRARRAAEGAVMAASQNYDNALARLRELQRPATGSDQNAMPASKPAATASNPPADRNTRSNAFLARHPDVKQALNAYANARVNFQYGAIFRSLGLTADQIARMQTLLSAGHGMGITGPNGQSLSLVSGDGPRPLDWKDQVQDILDPNDAARFMDYYRGGASRDMAARVASALWYTDAPLSPIQADQLAGIVLASEIYGSNSGSSYNWDALITKAQEVLSPTQISVLGSFKAGDELNDALGRLYSSP